MALMISTGSHYHHVKSIFAHTYGDGALRLTLRGNSDASDMQANEVDITVFTDDVALTERLIAAINGASEAPTPEAHFCERCNGKTLNPENEYGEFICINCEENAAEAAYERHCEDFHDGGATRFVTLEQQQAEARRLK